ncbi:MAG: hypothetical protein IKC64_03740 [Clostridia bacterium]|nr:hypothetical protein [Clostridia bacterium]
MRKRSIFCVLFLLTLTVISSCLAFNAPPSLPAYGATTTYVADFSNGKPSDWAYYDRGDNANAIKIAKSTNGITLGNNPVDGAGDISDYYGTVYKIAQSLGNVSDFTLEMSYRVLSYENTTRWIGIVYHTNTDMADRLSGLDMNYRVNGKSAGSVITAGESSPSFRDFNEVEGNPSHNGTDFINLKIVVSGDTATHYANGNEITSYSISSKTSATNGGFALIVNRSTIEISSLTINATHSQVAKFYSADFTDGVSEFTTYEKCDTVNTVSAKTYTDGAITGLQIQNSGDSMTPSNYFGSVYEISDDAIANIGDFEMTVRFRIVNPTNTTRWFGVAFHTQKNASNMMGGYMYGARYNGEAQATTFTPTPSFNDQSRYQNGYGHDGSIYRTLGVKVSAGFVTHYIEGYDTVSGTTIAQYTLENRESILGTQYKSGGFALFANQCSVQISSINIKSYTRSESYSTGSYKSADLKYAPVTALEFDESDDFNTLKSSAKPEHIIFNTDDNLSVLDKNNQVICTLADALNKTSAYSLPVIKINSTTAKDKFIKFIELERNYDISVMSSNKSILTAIRKSSFGKNIRAIYDWTTTTLNGKADWQKVVADSNSSQAHIALISADDATQESVRYIQSRLKTVWVTIDGNDRFAVTKAVTTGAFGIVGTDLSKVSEAFALFNGNDYNQLRAPVNIAHRGLCHEFAEGSDLAYKQAVAQGATYLEVDIHLTKDKQLVLMHNSTIDATTNGSGRVVDMTLAEIQQYQCDVFSTDYNTQVDKSKWGKVWSVDEMFNEFKSNEDVVYAFEWKTNDEYAVEVLKTLLDKYQNYDQIFVITFNDNMVRKMRDYIPQVPVASLNYKSANESGYKFMQENNCYCDTNGYGNEVYTELMKHRGYMPFYWTLLTQKNINNAIKLGCFGITNNRANAISHYPVSLSAIDEQVHNASATALTQNGYQGYLTSYDGTKSSVHASVLDMRTDGGVTTAILTTTFTTSKTPKTQITDAYADTDNFSYAVFSNPVEFRDNKSVTVSGENISVDGFASGDEFLIGSTINGTIKASDGYQISQVLINGNSQPITNKTNFPVEFVISENTTISVTTAPLKYGVTVAGGHISTSGFTPGSEHAPGTVITGTITPSNHYEITQVRINGVEQTVTDKTCFSVNLTLDQDFTISVTATLIKHGITVSGENFSISGFTSGDAFNYGSYAYGVILPSPGYSISEVIVDGQPQTVDNPSQFYLSLFMNADHTVSVITTTARHTVTVSGENFSINGFTSGDEFNYGSTISGTINANNGYKITSVKVDGVEQTITNDKSFTLDLTVNKNHSIVVTTEVVPTSPVSSGCGAKADALLFSFSLLALFALIKRR